MANGKVFPQIADSYQSGELDANLDMVFDTAAADGIILLPGDGRPYVPAKGGSFAVDDLLLPFDKAVWQTITKAHDAGIDVFPEWFTYNPAGYFEFTQEDLLVAFIRCKKLTKHRGNFLMEGQQVSRPVVKGALRRSLAIVRKDAGRELYGAMAALDTIVQDDEPGGEKSARMTRAVLAAAVKELGFSVKYNLITCSYEIDGRTPAGRAASQDDLCVLLHDTLADSYKGTSLDIIAQYTAMEARENAYNPVLELLQSTQWDGTDRLPQLYSIMGIENDPLSQTLTMKWLFQTVALLFNDAADPYGADGCLVLNGDQGTGKTSLFRHLAMRDAWFGEGCSIDDRDKDTSRRVVTKWISELGEVESTLKSDISKLKAFITAAVDSYRLPYGKSDTTAPRHTSLCATCNSDRYLIDPTGNRRWWSVPFTRTVPREELLALDALQLWCQIFAIVEPMTTTQRAACYRLTAEEQADLAVRNGEFEKPSKAQDEVADILEKAARDHLATKIMTVSELKAMWEVLRPYSVQQISAALKRCGIEITKGSKGKRTAELPTPAPIQHM